MRFRCAIGSKSEFCFLECHFLGIAIIFSFKWITMRFRCAIGCKSEFSFLECHFLWITIIFAFRWIAMGNSSCTILYPGSHEWHYCIYCLVSTSPASKHCSLTGKVVKHHDPLCTGLGLINKCASNDSVTVLGIGKAKKNSGYMYDVGIMTFISKKK